MAVTECGIRKNLAKYYGQKNAPARLEGVGGEGGQTPVFFGQILARVIKTGATEVSLSGQNWENLQLTAKLSRPAPAGVAPLLTGSLGYDDHHEERAHATRSRGAHRIG